MESLKWSFYVYEFYQVSHKNGKTNFENRVNKREMQNFVFISKFSSTK